MKYALRFVWYVLRIVIITASAFAILVVAFFVAMDSANVYVVVTDGMKARTTSALIPAQTFDPAKYYSKSYINNQTNLNTSKYSNFVITDINYKLSVESLWCNPWKNTASVTAVESIPTMAYSSTAEVPEGKTAPVPPQWQRTRYKINCIKIDDLWRIDSIETIDILPPAPTPTPEPSTYISASPLPSPSPTTSISVTASASPTPSAKK